jgi:hypothetical protein
MVKLAKVFFFLILCTFVYAADGLTLYTDPDFPDFSFEYDPSVWTIEQQTFNPVISQTLKSLTVTNLNGEEIIFRFEAPIETGFEGLFYTFRAEDITFIGGVAVRVKGDNSYYPQHYFTSCLDNLKECQEHAEMMRFPPPSQDIVAVGDRVGVFYTQVTQSFINNLVSNVMKEWGNRAWLFISVEPEGLESYQADEIISTLTY